MRVRPDLSARNGFGARNIAFGQEFDDHLGIKALFGQTAANPGTGP